MSALVRGTRSSGSCSLKNRAQRFVAWPPIMKAPSSTVSFDAIGITSAAPKSGRLSGRRGRPNGSAACCVDAWFKAGKRGGLLVIEFVGGRRVLVPVVELQQLLQHQSFGLSKMILHRQDYVTPTRGARTGSSRQLRSRDTGAPASAAECRFTQVQTKRPIAQRLAALHYTPIAGGRMCCSLAECSRCGSCLLQVFGGARGSRTPDLLNAIQALSQLSYGPITVRRRSGRAASLILKSSAL